MRISNVLHKKKKKKPPFEKVQSFSIGKRNVVGHVSEEINAVICSRARIRTPSTPARIFA